MFDINLANLGEINGGCACVYRQIGKFYTDWDYLIDCFDKYLKLNYHVHKSRWWYCHFGHKSELDFDVLFLFQRFGCIQHWSQQPRFKNDYLSFEPLKEGYNIWSPQNDEQYIKLIE